MLLKERICTFEEVQDHARALFDGLIGKYSIETQQQVSIFLNYELIKLMFFKVAQKASDQEAEGSICYKIGLLYFKYGDFNKTIDFQNKYLQISSNNVVKIYLSQF